MDATLLSVGNFQPIPFPAPVSLLQVLLVIGFLLHALPMNVALTGGLVSAILLLVGGKDENAHTTRAGKDCILGGDYRASSLVHKASFSKLLGRHVAVPHHDPWPFEGPCCGCQLHASIQVRACIPYAILEVDCEHHKVQPLDLTTAATH